MSAFENCHNENAVESILLLHYFAHGPGQLPCSKTLL
jgi:hypothetical protein